MFHGISQALQPSDVQMLEESGYAILHNAIPTDSAINFLRDIKKAARLNLFKPNKVEFQLSIGAVQVTKPFVYECDCHDTGVLAQLPAFDSLFSVGGDIFNLANMLRTAVPSLEDLCCEFDPRLFATVKLQVNSGGCFPWHYDNPGPPNKRRLTIGVYLSEHWEAQDGGELVLMPFLRPSVYVVPKFVTVVLFRSDLVLHRVLPVNRQSKKNRCCFTLWLDGTKTNADGEVNLRLKQLDVGSVPFLRSSPLQRALSRAVYEELYREALLECFGSESKDAKLSLEIHDTHVKQLRACDTLANFIDHLKRIASEFII